MPHELVIAGVMFSPLVPVCAIGIAGAAGVTFMCNRFGISRYFVHMPWVFVGFSILFGCLAYGGLF